MTQGYEADLIDTLWGHAGRQGHLERLDQPRGLKLRPPVFKKEAAAYNVIVAPQATEQQRSEIGAAIPLRARHRWYHSMASSQALAQSVFANLAVLSRLDVLERIRTDSGEPLLGFEPIGARLEHEVDYLGELEHKTSIDVLVTGPDGRRVAFECKLREQEVGACSRPALTAAKDKNFEADHCDGSYTVQRKRVERCSLTQAGIGYWRYIPQLFSWESDRDWGVCPLRRPYQLVRNVLAASVQPDRSVDPAKGHCVLVYDTRNPAFQPGGAGAIAFEEASGALLTSGTLRKISWQRIIGAMLADTELRGLGAAVQEKYGFTAS